MTDQELNALQEKIEQDTFDIPEELEALIKDTSEKVARELAFKSNSQTRAEFQDEVFIFSAKKVIRGFKQVIFFAIANENHYKAVGSKYRPYTVTLEVDNSFDYVDNLKAGVESFLRHISGAIMPQELEE